MDCAATARRSGEAVSMHGQHRMPSPHHAHAGERTTRQSYTEYYEQKHTSTRSLRRMRPPRLLRDEAESPEVIFGKAVEACRSTVTTDFTLPFKLQTQRVRGENAQGETRAGDKPAVLRRAALWNLAREQADRQLCTCVGTS